MPAIVYLSLLILAQIFHSNNAATVTISNLKPRTNLAGEIIDAHDGSIQQFEVGGIFYYHAVGYGLCKEPEKYGCDQTSDHCGFQLNHTLAVWSTPDLSQNSWKFEGITVEVDERPAGIVYRPHAVYNPITKEHVLWWNYVGPDRGGGEYAVASSRDPAGKFVLKNKSVNVSRLATHPGDFDLFVDDDGTGYIIYSSGFYMSIEQLTQDYYYSTGKNSSCGPGNSPLFPDYFVEAPAIFKRNGIYYALFGHCCCFCEQGSGILVYSAKSMLGPWIPQTGGDIACRNSEQFSPKFSKNFDVNDSVGGIPTPDQGCLYKSNQTSVTRSQQNYVIKVKSTKGDMFIWTGDRWQQAPDGIKGHEPQFWVPLEFDDSGRILDVNWVDEFSFDI